MGFLDIKQTRMDRLGLYHRIAQEECSCRLEDDTRNSNSSFVVGNVEGLTYLMMRNIELVSTSAFFGRTTYVGPSARLSSPIDTDMD